MQTTHNTGGMMKNVSKYMVVTVLFTKCLLAGCGPSRPAAAVLPSDAAPRINLDSGIYARSQKSLVELWTDSDARNPGDSGRLQVSAGGREYTIPYVIDENQLVHTTIPFFGSLEELNKASEDQGTCLPYCNRALLVMYADHTRGLRNQEASSLPFTCDGKSVEDSATALIVQEFTIEKAEPLAFLEDIVLPLQLPITIDFSNAQGSRYAGSLSIDYVLSYVDDDGYQEVTLLPLVIADQETIAVPTFDTLTDDDENASEERTRYDIESATDARTETSEAEQSGSTADLKNKGLEHALLEETSADETRVDEEATHSEERGDEETFSLQNTAHFIAPEQDATDVDPMTVQFTVEYAEAIYYADWEVRDSGTEEVIWQAINDTEDSTQVLLEEGSFVGSYQEQFSLEENTAYAIRVRYESAEGTMSPWSEWHAFMTGTYPTDPITETVVEPVADPITEAVVEPVADPITEAVVEPVADPITEAVVEPVADPITEAVVEPIVEAVVGL
jgi:hypothetical protein